MALETSNGVVQLISRDEDGNATSVDSNNGAISADGRYVAFRSNAALVAEDTNGTWDAYLVDRKSGDLTLLSQSENGNQADNDVFENIRISNDGRFVAFGLNDASGLVGGPVGAASVIYDHELGTLAKFSAQTDAAEGHFTSHGTFVYDETQTLNCNGTLTEEGSARLYNPRTDVATTIVTHCQAPGSVRDPDLSENSGILAYQMIQSGFNHFTYVPYEHYIYTYDRASNTAVNITVSAMGEDANGVSYSPSISDSGRYVAFESDATNLTPDDINGARDVFLYDRRTDVMLNVTEGSDSGSGNVEITGNGRYITFQSTATNLVEDGRSTIDTYVFDRVTDTISQLNPPSPSYFHTANPMKSEAASVYVFETREGFAADEIHASNVDVYLVDGRFSDGADTVSLQNWGETAYGMQGNDRITGSARRDTVFGGDGADRLKGLKANDKLFGNNGNDTLIGGAGADKAIGGRGNDVLLGGAGNDLLKGLSGKDTFKGGAGKDTMYAGNDAQTDRFVFSAISDSMVGSKRDVIHQFDRGEDDIVLKAIDANTNAGGNQAFKFSGTQAKANSVWFVDTGRDVQVRGDVDGNKIADFQITLSDINGLNVGDFIL